MCTEPARFALYDDLAEWWPLVSWPEEYADEAAAHRSAMRLAARRPLEEVLELGCGGGNIAAHLKRHWRMTLTDLSPSMLAVSRALNPECDHAAGDMRTLRLDRRFDAVFVHDAVMYMRTEADLLAAMGTAFAHCRPGGVALFAPDCTRETWTPRTGHGGHDAGGRSLRYLECFTDPDPGDTAFDLDMVYLLRERAGPARVVHDRHVLGVFPRAVWARLLAAAGFEVAASGGDAPAPERFVGVRPE